MKYERTTAPSSCPITLDQAKAHLVVEHNDDDDLIALYLAQAVEYAESQTGLSAGAQVWTVYGDDWCGVLELPFKPVVGVVVKYDAVDATEQTLPVDQYYLDAKAYPARICLPAGGVWPEPAAGPNVVRVEVNTGYTELPKAMEAGILLMLGTLYENREGVTPGQVMELPMGVTALLNSVRVSFL